MNDSTIKLKKLDAACRQLRTAITLWFDQVDVISAHALAVASYEVFHTVSLHRDPNRRDLIFDTDYIKDEFRRKWIKHVKREANFFKHADQDPEGEIEFNPDYTEFFIFYASYARRLCGCPQSSEETLFGWWLQINRPEMLTEQGRKFISDRVPIDAIESMRRLSRSQFREAFLKAGIKNRPIIEIV